jgi:hypothetical protein
MIDLTKLVNEYPNDMELGKKIRELVVEKKSIFPSELEYTDEYYKKQWVDPYHPNRKESFEYDAENPAV